MISVARAYLRWYRLSAVILFTALGLLLLAAPYAVWRDAGASARAALPATTYKWLDVADVQANWQTVGAPCYSVPQPGTLRMVCQSAGLVTRQEWSRHFPLTATATVSATAYAGERYFAGLTIYDNHTGDTRYGESALCKLAPPCHHWGSGDQFTTLVDDGGYPPLASVVEGQAYELGVVYRPNGSMAAYDFYLDGVKNLTRPGQAHTNDLSIFILCVSVGENTPDDGTAAECHFGPVTVQGVMAEAVVQAWFPVAGGPREAYP